MAKKKPPIEGVGHKPEELLVQKSRPLFALWKSDLTLQEFKILDTYLARIDSHHPEKRGVIFEKGELEQLLGVSKINLPQLRERLKHLMGNVVEVGDPNQPKSMHLITLFDEAVAIQDEVTGLWEVRLECTQKAMKYCFNIEKLGYLRYKLRGIVSLQSRYSYILFLYIESHRKFKSWTVPLDELKDTLKCTTEATYKEFKRFNDLILKRCSKEIFEKTDQRFTYAPVKKGRSVAAIRFEVETLPSIEVPEINQEQMSLFTGDPDDYPMNLYMAACPEFSRTQMEQVVQILVTVPEKKLPANADSVELRRYHYLMERMAAMAIQNERDIASGKGPIKHRHSYFIAMLKGDAGTK